MIRLFDGTRVVAPDLGHIAAQYSVEELERAIRRGVRPDGTSVIRLMPSEMLSTISDEDLGMIIAWMRAQPDNSDELPDSRYGPVARIMGLMAVVSRSRFAHFTDGEIDALYSYLNSVDSWVD